ncbi:hypothetical protein BCR34DRAFT_561312 [Clohesyomyces aquaticus]|uniref:DUF6594 domain-containing protein n=1 Tax=Clohesyomyces aquaticus TaxID=1231657 RepID=A0A1Y1ZUQ4_9PLEO|nr:hypothetical protein BCR34DRAFT_561312 [Clohesyomyces aquaticus]
MRTGDLEHGEAPDGYPALTNWIAADPDNETFVFRKFDRLAARNLLNLQSELFEIEAALDGFDVETSKGEDVTRKMSARDWGTFVENFNDPQGPKWAKDRRRLELDLRSKIKEYHEALALQASIIGLERPSNRVLNIFGAWFSGESRGETSTIIAGKARKMLKDEDDLVTLKTGDDQDTLSNLIKNHWPLKGKSGQSSHDSTRYFRLRHVRRTVAIISTIVAVALLVGAIVVLYFVKRNSARLGLIAAFTVLFGLSLRFLTNARRAEIFGASAAYAAVLVVFVSGNLGST